MKGDKRSISFKIHKESYDILKKYSDAQSISFKDTCKDTCKDIMIKYCEEIEGNVNYFRNVKRHMNSI